MRSRCLMVLAVAGIAVAVRPSATAGGDPLATLYEAHDWFALRDAVREDSAPFYRGAVAYAFNDAAGARKYLEAAIAAAAAGSDEATEARGLLIYLYQRERQYAAALEQVRAIQKMLPDAPGLKNAEALFAALGRYPEQSIVRGDPTTSRYAMKGGNLFIPVNVNGTRADYMIDTGANFSVMSESEAKRLRLTVTESGATGTVVTGAQVPFRTALAPTVEIGGARLRNVVFLVSPDSNQPFVSLQRGWRGALGIPVLLALQTFTWTADGQFETGGAPDRRDLARANLCFEGASPVVLAAFGGKRLPLVLDTGATKTNLGPRFAQEFADAVRGATKHSRVVGGVGDRVTVESLSVPEIELELGGGKLRLHPAHVLLRQLAADDRWFYGRLGIDALRQASRVALDFGAMTLRLAP